MEQESNTFPIKESPYPTIAFLDSMKPWSQITRLSYTNNTMKSYLSEYNLDPFTNMD